MNTLETCRLCLEKFLSNGDTASLRCNSFQTALSRVFPFEFKLETVLPEYACSLCSKRVWEFSAYSEFVENNQRQLQQDRLSAPCAENEDVKSLHQNSGSPFKNASSVCDAIGTAGPMEQLSDAIGFNDSIEVGKYEVQVQENEKSDRFNGGIQLSKVENEYGPAPIKHEVSQSCEGSIQEVQEKPYNSDSTRESSGSVRNEASASDAGGSFTSGDTGRLDGPSAGIRKDISRNSVFIDNIEIDGNDLQTLEKEEIECAIAVREANPIVQRVTEPKAALKNSAKTNEAKNRTAFVCDYCKQTFVEQCVLEKHFCRELLSENTNTKKQTKPTKQTNRRESYGHRLVPCSICAGQVERKDLKRHMNAHKGAFHCKICGKNLSSSRRLREHQNTVHAKQTEICPICGKQVKRSMLKRHIEGHENQQCPICAKQIQSRTLKEHIKAHDGAFRCDRCDRNLSSLSKLRRHQSSVHSAHKH